MLILASIRDNVVMQSGRKADDDMLITIYKDKNKIPFSWEPLLAPDQHTFDTYQDLRNIGNWNPVTFMTDYVPSFLKAMTEYPRKQALTELKAKAIRGNIIVRCFCTQESTCHRSIIGGILAGVGVPVYSWEQKRLTSDYNIYWELYQYAAMNSPYGNG